MIQTEIKYNAMIHYEHFPGSLDICKIYSVSKSICQDGYETAPDANPHANGPDHQVHRFGVMLVLMSISYRCLL
jgi:hypothetical protein